MTMTEDEGAAMLPRELWAAAEDGSLPPGVVAFKDSRGRWWRYPLAEFNAPDQDECGGTYKVEVEDGSYTVTCARCGLVTASGPASDRHFFAAFYERYRCERVIEKRN